MKVHTYVRERSMRCAGKNFRELGGEPLWRRTLRKYREFQVYLDTDSEQLLQDIAQDPELSHVIAYRRLTEHTVDPDPGLAMTRRFLEEWVADPDEPVALVHVTSPFLDPRRTKAAWDQVCDPDSPFDSAASVTEIRDFCFRHGKHGPVPVNHDFRTIPRTQDLDPVWHLNHAFYVFSRTSLERRGHRVGDHCLFVPLPFPESVDIDWEEDFRLAEALVELEGVAA